MQINNNLTWTQKSFMTVFFIFVTALLLFISGCQKSQDKNQETQPEKPVQNQDNQPPQNLDPDADSLVELNPQMPELKFIESDQVYNLQKISLCTPQQVNNYNTRLQDIKFQEQSLKNASKLTNVQSQTALKNYEYCLNINKNNVSPICKRSLKTIVEPDNNGFAIYDWRKFNKFCNQIHVNLKRLQLITDSPQKPQPETPWVTQPSVPQPTKPLAPDAPIADTAPPQSIRECSTEEFNKLLSWSKQLDAAQKEIHKLKTLGEVKYNATAISLASPAVISCESLAQYHAENQCQKTVQSNGVSTPKYYNKQNLDQRCLEVRTYFYNFVQNKKTLLFKNADLFLSLISSEKSTLGPQEMVQVGKCVLTNKNESELNLNISNARVLDTRGFEDKIAVLETEQGLLVQCYGLKWGESFSKTQLEKLMNETELKIKLEYKLK